jgi:hypothetical protein
MEPLRQDPIRSAEFTNHLRVGHTVSEFYLEFGQDRDDQVHVHTLLVTSLPFIRAIIGTLTESMDAYEREFGPICQPEGSHD